MANKSRGSDPGAYTTNGVHCTLDVPFKQGAKPGAQKNLAGTFDEARTGGDNGLPTRVTDPMGGPGPAGPGLAARTSSMGTIKTSPNE